MKHWQRAKCKRCKLQALAAAARTGLFSWMMPGWVSRMISTPYWRADFPKTKTWQALTAVTCRHESICHQPLPEAGTLQQSRKACFQSARRPSDAYVHRAGISAERPATALRNSSGGSVRRWLADSCDAFPLMAASKSFRWHQAVAVRRLESKTWKRGSGPPHSYSRNCRQIRDSLRRRMQCWNLGAQKCQTAHSTSTTL